MKQHKRIGIKEAIPHEAGHAIVTLGIGCLIYEMYIGDNTMHSLHSSGFIHRGTQTKRQSAVISVAGCVADWLTEMRDNLDGEFSLRVCARRFKTAKQYSNDYAQFKQTKYSLRKAIIESRDVLLESRKWFRFLIRNLKKKENHNRLIEAGEIFELAGMRLLDANKVVVPKDKVLDFMRGGGKERGYHLWLKKPVLPYR